MDVERIVEEVAAGRSVRDLAKRLDAEQIASPHGDLWSQLTMRGDPVGLVGILDNSLTIGNLVWNARE